MSKYQQRRADEHEQHRPRVAGQLAEQVHGRGLEPLARAVHVGVIAPEPVCDRGHRGGGFRQRDAGLQASEDLQRREDATLLGDAPLGGGAERTGRRRHVDVAVGRVLRNRRQHADDGVRPVVHLEGLADDVGVAAKPRAPVFVAQHQHRRGSRIVVAVDERAAELRAHAEHVEEVGRDHAGVHAVGLPAVQQVERHLVELHQPAEAGELLTVVVELGDRDADGVLTGKRRRFLEQHQSIALHVRQRLEQHAVDDAEHRGVGPDAQAKHQDGDQREPRLAPERSCRIAHRAHGPIEPQQARVGRGTPRSRVPRPQTASGRCGAPRLATRPGPPGAWPRGRDETAARCRADRRAAHADATRAPAVESAAA